MLSEINIPDTVTSIGAEAFYGCSSLQSIELFENVTSIGDRAFSGCENLDLVRISCNTDLGECIFEDCTGLRSVELPGNLSGIDLALPAECSIKCLSIAEDSTEINFENNSYNLVKELEEVYIPESVIKIGDNAFYGASRLTEIRIPNEVTSIGNSAFAACEMLSEINIPDTVTSIGWHAFEDCTSLTDVTIPDGVTEIGWNVFTNCTSLRNVIIPDSVTRIGWNAFENCTSLTNVTIPNSVVKIDSDAFNNCEALESITIENPECEIYDSAITIPNSTVIYGYDDSTAQDYALAHGNEFVSLGKYPKESDNGYTSKMLESGVTMLVNENQTDVYLIYAIDSLDYSSVGFAIEYKGKNAYKYMTKAYQSIDIDGVTYKAEDFGGSYIVALHIANVGKDGLDDFNARQKTKPNNIKLDIDKPKNTKEDQ